MWCSRRLTIATIICLPLTFLTGYFVRIARLAHPCILFNVDPQGMNFEAQWSVHSNSDLLYVLFALDICTTSTDNAITHSFWKVAIPIMAVIIPLFVLPDIKRMIHYVEKKHLLNKL